MSELSRRERQIMDLLHARGEATVQQIREGLPDPPTPMAVRRQLALLEEKGMLRRRKQGREVVYAPRQSSRRVGLDALRHVLDTFFGGSLETALASHLEQPRTRIDADEARRLADLIDSLARTADGANAGAAVDAGDTAESSDSSAVSTPESRPATPRPRPSRRRS